MPTLSTKISILEEVRTTGVRSIHLGHNVKNHIVSQHDFDAPKQANIDVMLSEIWSLGSFAICTAPCHFSTGICHEARGKPKKECKQETSLATEPVESLVLKRRARNTSCHSELVATHATRNLLAGFVALLQRYGLSETVTAFCKPPSAGFICFYGCSFYGQTCQPLALRSGGTYLKSPKQGDSANTFAQQALQYVGRQVCVHYVTWRQRGGKQRKLITSSYLSHAACKAHGSIQSSWCARALRHKRERERGTMYEYTHIMCTHVCTSCMLYLRYPPSSTPAWSLSSSPSSKPSPSQS